MTVDTAFDAGVEAGLAVAASDGRWMILHVLPQREKRVANVIVRDGFEVFLPLERKMVRNGNKRVPSETPLIPGYVFPKFDPDRLPDLDKDEWRWAGVERLLIYAGGVDVPYLVPDEAMDRLIVESNRGAFDRTRKGVKGTEESMRLAGLKPGGRLRVVEGPSTGLGGRILAAKPGDRLAVLLDGLNWRADVGLAQVRPL